MPKQALITGITGQTGSFLAEFLLDKGYVVSGMIRRSSSFNTKRIDNIFDRLNLYYGDLSCSNDIANVVSKSKPDEIYHLGAMSHVKVSFEQPEYTFDVGALGTLRLLEAVRMLNIPHIKIYNASSSEMFGNAPAPQNEQTPFQPRSPYAVAKVAAHHFCSNYREAYSMFICNGILFNHESERRGETFVTRKITRALGRIKVGLQKKLILGNLDARRDWGYAKDFVEAIWLMLQQEKPDDYVIATEETHLVSEFLEEAFIYLNLNYKEFVEIDEKYYRPTEVNCLMGDCSKAKSKLGWTPKTHYKELVKIMVDHDLELAKKELIA